MTRDQLREKVANSLDGLFNNKHSFEDISEKIIDLIQSNDLENPESKAVDVDKLSESIQEMYGPLEDIRITAGYVDTEDEIHSSLSRILSSLDDMKILLSKTPTPQSECKWFLEDPDAEDDQYYTGCNNRFVLIDGSPKENGMKHCCYCGKNLVEKPTPNEDS